MPRTSSAYRRLKPLLCVICLLALSIPGAQAAIWPQYKIAGFKAFEQGNHADALEYFESALILAYFERAPAKDLGGVLENLATVYFALGNPLDAWGSIEQWDYLMAQSRGQAWVSEQKSIRDPLARLISEALDQAQVRTESSHDVAPAAASSPSAPTPGDYAIHLESAEAESNVRSSWDRLRATYPAQIADKSLLVKQIDLGDRGVFYRILAGPFADASAADTACRELEGLGQYCAVYSLE